MQAIKERRSIRKYRPDPVPDEMLQTILEAARWAPSWANSQCWRLIIIRDPETKSKLADTLKSRKPGGRNSATDGMRQAPIVIAACAERWLSGFYATDDKQRVVSTEKGESWYMFDVGLAMQNATLVAHALGLGTVHVGFFDTEKVSKILGIPDNIVVVELMVLGWPDEKPPVRPRKEISEFVFHEKYPS
jgi:nitroreductase